MDFTELTLDNATKQTILTIRGCRVMIDADLASLYGVTTKALNQAVKRNAYRFPPDFMFQLSKEEKQEVVTICDHLKKLIYSNKMPLVFSEYGALMLANILKSQRAVTASIFVVRAFAKLREMASVHKDLALRIDELERRYDGQFQTVFEALRQLMRPPENNPKKIGFGRVP